MRLATAFDGQFYPAEAQELSDSVDLYLKDAPRPDGKLLGLVVPHAGYVYSGATAGRAIGMLSHDPPDAVVVLGPSHRVYFEGLRVFELEGYETPLGPLPGEPDLAQEIARGLDPEAGTEAFCEHSVEVQLPLLARALPGVPVVQLVFGVTSAEEIHDLVDVLVELRGKRHLAVVASSDLSHFHDRERALELDGRFRVLLEAGDPLALRRAIESGETEACGSGPVLTLMELAQRSAARIETIQQTDSSAASGDEEQVVGYLSAAVLLNEDRG